MQTFKRNTALDDPAAPDAEALIEEVRHRTRVRRLRNAGVTALLVTALLVGFAVGGVPPFARGKLATVPPPSSLAGVSSTENGRVSSIPLPVLNFSTLFTAHGGVWFFGEPRDGVCVLMKVDEDPLRAVSSATTHCGINYLVPLSPDLTKPTVAVVGLGRPSFAVQYRLVSVSTKGQLLLGEVFGSTSYPLANHSRLAYGGGSLFVGSVNNGGSSTPGVIEQFSATTGALQRRLVLPVEVGNYSLFADANGLFVTVLGVFGVHPPMPLIYHVPPGGSALQPFDPGKILSILWMGPSGNQTFAEVIAKGDEYEIVRFVGPQATMRPLAAVHGYLPTSEIVGDSTDGLWTLSGVTPPSRSTTENTVCDAVEGISHLELATGQAHRVATLPPGVAGVGLGCSAFGLSRGQGLATGGAFYLMDGSASTDNTNGYKRLYRVSAGGT